MTRAWTVMTKDLRMGPRSPLFLFAIILPVALTFLIVGVFGSLFAPSPRLGIVDEGDSAIVASAAALDGIEVTTVTSVASLRQMVEANDLDAGLVLTEGFDAALAGGERPELSFLIGGESLASNRIILEVTALDLVRSATGADAPVDVEVLTLGDAEAIPIATRMVPLLMIYAVAIAGAFVPAASIVEEKENGAIHSVLVTPTTMREYLAGKGGLGIILAMATGAVTLLLNQAFGTNPLLLLAILLIASVMMAQLGLMAGMYSEDSNMLFALMKGGGILVFYPVVFYIWPNLPEWIAKIAPTYWFLEPIFEVGVRNAGLSDVWVSMLVALAWIAVFTLAVRATSRRFEQRVAITA